MVRSPQNFGHHLRLAFLRDHVLHRQSARGGRKLGVIPMIHVTEIQLVEFISDHPLVGLASTRVMGKGKSPSETLPGRNSSATT
jgi:hypothetical protein